MALEQWLPYFLGGGIVVVFGVLTTRNYMRARVWCQGTQLAAKKYRLTYMPVRGFMMPEDMARGEHGDLSIRIEVDTESHGHGDRSREVRFAKLEVHGGWSRKLVMEARSAQKRKDTGIIDYAAAPRDDRPTPVDPTFDAVVAVRNATPALLEALRASELRELVQDLSRFGLRIEDSELILRSRRFPKTAQELVERVDRMVAVAEHLKRLA
jgi:hypothetical protein